MSSRFKRYTELFASDREKLLAVLGSGRKAVQDANAKLLPSSPTYRSGLAIISAIDDLAEIVTGDRRYFALKGHGGSFSPRPQDRGSD